MRCYDSGPGGTGGPFDSKIEEQRRRCKECGQEQTKYSDSFKKELGAMLKAMGQSR